MREISAELQERNQAIGHAIREARIRKNISVSKCAQLLTTSRRRYVAMERGEVMIGAVELEALMNFLELPEHTVWPANRNREREQPVVVKAQRGETIRIEIAIQ